MSNSLFYTPSRLKLSYIQSELLDFFVTDQKNAEESLLCNFPRSWLKFLKQNRFRWPIYVINSVAENLINMDYIPTDAAPQFFRKLPPLFILFKTK